MIKISRLFFLFMLFMQFQLQGQFSENFDGYSDGQDLHGIGGWAAWANNATFTASTSSLQSNSPSNALLIDGSSDIVRELSGINSGIWTVEIQSFVPLAFTGRNIIVLLNKYAVPIMDINWSTELAFDAPSGMFISLDENNSTPIVFDSWTEVRVVIDFDNDLQSIFYNDIMVSQKSWTNGVGPVGILELDAIDFTSDSSTPVFYDDIRIYQDLPVPSLTFWGLLILFLLLISTAIIVKVNVRDNHLESQI